MTADRCDQEPRQQRPNHVVQRFTDVSSFFKNNLRGPQNAQSRTIVQRAESPTTPVRPRPENDHDDDDGDARIGEEKKMSLNIFRCFLDVVTDGAHSLGHAATSGRRAIENVVADGQRRAEDGRARVVDAVARNRGPPPSQSDDATPRDAHGREITLLWSTRTVREHAAARADFVSVARGLEGGDGLARTGFQYRRTFCGTCRRAAAAAAAAARRGTDAESTTSTETDSTFPGSDTTMTTTSDDQDQDHASSGDDGPSTDDATRRELDFDRPTSLDDVSIPATVTEEPLATTEDDDRSTSTSEREEEEKHDDSSSSNGSTPVAVAEKVPTTEDNESQTETTDQDTTDDVSKSNNQNHNTTGSHSLLFSEPVRYQIDDDSTTATNTTTTDVHSTAPQHHDRLDHHCPDCRVQLYHMASGFTLVNEENRKRFVADGEMYEQVARLCQETAQQMMALEGDMEWTTLFDDDDGEPVRALVSRRRPGTPSSSPTLLVATGKGRVRAGIFSRQHLLTTGVEESTALSFVREARQRDVRVVLLDPNARSEKEGMLTFVRSLDGLRSSRGGPLSDDAPLLALAHSQGGAQLVRYALRAGGARLAARFAAVAFTDSTHNVNWTKQRVDVDDDALPRLLECPERSIYVKSSDPRRDDDWERRRAGEAVETDDFWTHRFGAVRTVYAGTREHSLINWTGRTVLWEFFDDAMERAT